MLPEVEEYHNAVTKAKTDYDNARQQVREHHTEWNDSYYNALGRAEQEYFRARREAKKTLQKNAKHSLVQWLTDPNKGVFADDYRWGHAEKILVQLPATEKQLNDYALDHGWCGTWDTLRDRALADGALDGYVTLQFQQNAKEWQEFRRSIRMTDGEMLSRDDIMKWFRRGVKEFEFKIRRSTYRFRLIDTAPIK